jgi:hypothetical protein
VVGGDERAADAGWGASAHGVEQGGKGCEKKNTPIESEKDKSPVKKSGSCQEPPAPNRLRVKKSGADRVRVKKSGAYQD